MKESLVLSDKSIYTMHFDSANDQSQYLYINNCKYNTILLVILFLFDRQDR
jgi:hypothetical protein